MEFNELRRKYPKFIYEGFETSLLDGKLKIIFNFSLGPDLKFKPEVILPNVTQGQLDKIGQDQLNNLVFNLGLVEMISYWKLACSPEIEIKAGFLEAEQISWWKDLILKGLGQFFYENNIDFNIPDLVKIVCQTENPHPSAHEMSRTFQDRSLVLSSGGKDSAVTLDILSESGKKFNCLMLNPTEAAKQLANLAGCSNPIYISRNIDPKLLELNSQGYLNGHTPFSAYLAFLGVLAGAIYNYKNVIVSDEASSNEGNLVWMGSDINHQYSKSFEFEKLFNSYKEKYLVSGLNYFSLLRPLLDFQIIKIFSNLTKYQQIFRSCNKGQKTNSWCLNCPKCVYTYIALYPFLGKKLNEFIGGEVLENQKNIEIIEGLIGQDGKIKPLECVGTFEENRLAICLTIKKMEEENTPLPKVLESVFSEISNCGWDFEKLEERLLSFWNSENLLPKEFQELLKAKL